MINVGFRTIGSDKWVAGSNYLRNLFHAMSGLDHNQIEPVLFVGEKSGSLPVSQLPQNIKIRRTPLFDKMSPQHFVEKGLERLIGKQFALSRLLREHDIRVLSHASVTRSSICSSCKIINWIPDFQHAVLPEMFLKETIVLRNRKYRLLAAGSDILLLSSYCALKDFTKVLPEYGHKARVLPFVSTIGKEVYKEDRLEILKAKYGFEGKYFFLPNQFWQHKNHITVFKAVRLLKENKRDILIICSGYMDDYRNRGHAQKLRSFVTDNRLEVNIRILGLIDYSDVLHLLRNAVSVINPSLFEGWSSTVEEAKSMGKNLIVSDIAVHREQNPPASTYFNPCNEKELAEILWQKWTASDGGPDYRLEETARRSMQRRADEFGEQYNNIVLDVLR